VNNILRSKGGKMSLFKPIPENEAKEKVKEIYE